MNGYLSIYLTGDLCGYLYGDLSGYLSGDLSDYLSGVICPVTCPVLLTAAAVGRFSWQDFDDLSDGLSLDEGGRDLPPPMHPPGGGAEEALEEALMEADLSVVQFSHGALVNALTPCTHHPRTPLALLPHVDLARPALLNYEVSAEIIQQHAALLSKSFVLVALPC